LANSKYLHGQGICLLVDLKFLCGIDFHLPANSSDPETQISKNQRSEVGDQEKTESRTTEIRTSEVGSQRHKKQRSETRRSEVGTSEVRSIEVRSQRSGAGYQKSEPQRSEVKGQSFRKKCMALSRAKKARKGKASTATSESRSSISLRNFPFLPGPDPQ